MKRAGFIEAIRTDLGGLEDLIAEMKEALRTVETGKKINPSSVKIRKACQEAKHFLTAIRANAFDLRNAIE